MTRTNSIALTTLFTLLSSRRPLFVLGWYSGREHRTIRSCDRSSGPSYLTQSRGVHHDAPYDVHADVTENPRTLARDTFSVMAKTGRTWRRLRHMVDLARDNDNEQIQSIADVGCDHGLLAMGLAVSGRFESVVGVDVSERALQDGAVSLYNQLLDNIERDERWKRVDPEPPHTLLPLDFRVGDGLQVLEPGEADVLCIAGMGVNTMMQIMQPGEVDRLGCRQLILQPTNSRPRNLIRLYGGLADMGWTVTRERIEYQSSRWYISASFGRDVDSSAVRDSGEKIIPGQLLAQLGDDDPMSKAYDSYVHHHRKWIEQDSLIGSLHDDDRRWLAAIAHY